MNLEDSLKQIEAHSNYGGFVASVKFNRLENDFTDGNRVQVLYSDISYKSDEFDWKATMPTVCIPYRDPSLGFMLDGSVFSTVGVYSRSPGIVPELHEKVSSSKTFTQPKIDIVNVRSRTISIGFERNAIQITLSGSNTGGKKSIPIGIFLKAFSGLPYSEILKNFEYCPQILRNSFPSAIPEGKSNLTRIPTFGIETNMEPSLEACIDAVYSAIAPNRKNDTNKGYTTYWKTRRLKAFFSNLHFKTRQRYEADMSIGSRAIGTYLDEDIDIPYFENETVTETKTVFDDNGMPVDKTTTTTKEVVKHFTLPKGLYITAQEARSIHRYDISSLRVRTEHSFVIQENSPMFFRIKGYKLGMDIPEIDAHTGDIVDDDMLRALNDTKRLYVNVITPNGGKIVHRSSEEVEIGDFYGIINFLLTNHMIEKETSTSYSVDNHVIIDYDSRVRGAVKTVYEEIISSIGGTTELKQLLESLPKLPDNSIAADIRNYENKEVTQSDVTNIMSRAIAETKVSALMAESPDGMMPVQRGQYGRLDSFHAPDSVKIGSVHQTTVFARVNPDTNEIEAPYQRVINGKPVEGPEGIEYLTPQKENNKKIAAWNEEFVNPTVLVRLNGDVTTCAREQVDYRDVSPFVDMSVSRMCIPFPGFSQPKRALMATKMNGQAVPILFPERPIVSTGADTMVPNLYYTASDIITRNGLEPKPGTKLELLNMQWHKMLVEYKFVYDNHQLSFSVPFMATDKKSLYNYNLNYKSDMKYDLGDIVFFNQSCDIKGYSFWRRIQQGSKELFDEKSLEEKPALALGVNLRVCYKTYGSTSVDDALVISDRLITDNTVSNIQIIKYDYELRRDEEFPEHGWCAMLHTRAYKSQPIITAVDSGRNTPRSVFCKQEGEVVYVHKDEKNRSAEVWVATIHHAEIGDKMAGRYGNKSVIAKIVPQDMMPYDPKDGIPMDVVCTPLGIPSRMNLGQLLEVALGQAMAAESKDKKQIAVVTPFYPGIKKEIISEYTNAGLEHRRLFNPVYGKLTERPVNVGVMYMMKLEQMSNLKTSAVGYPLHLDRVFGQPTKSANSAKGQTIGEMETWALMAAGADETLSALFSYYSDDKKQRSNYFEVLANNGDSIDNPWDESCPEVTEHTLSRNALATQVIYRMLGCDIDVDKETNKFTVSPLKMSDITLSRSCDKFLRGEDKVDAETWFKVDLPQPVVNPFWILKFPLHKLLGVKFFKALAEGQAYLDTKRLNDREKCVVTEITGNKDKYQTGIDAVITLLRNTSIRDAMIYAVGGTASDDSNIIMSEDDDTTSEADTVVHTNNGDARIYSVVGDDGNNKWFVKTDEELSMEDADLLRFLDSLQSKGMTLQDLIWTEMPIIPGIFRQSSVINGEEKSSSFQQQLESICSSKATSQTIYEGLKQFIGMGSTNSKKDLESIRGYFFAYDSTSGSHGRIRDSVLSKRVGFSGRVVIVPMEDPSIPPYFIGLPWHVVMEELAEVLSIRLSKRGDKIDDAVCQHTDIPRSVIAGLSKLGWEPIVKSLGEFNPYVLRKALNLSEESVSDNNLFYFYNYLREVVREIVEGKVNNDGEVWFNGKWTDPMDLSPSDTIDCAVVISGRQPTLHKKSIRSYFIKLVDGYCMRIHPIVCKGYNADFDGDQMWHVQMFGESKVDSLQKLSIVQDLISEKDGGYTLELSQDVALGIYCATTFKNNAISFDDEGNGFLYFDNTVELRTQLEYGDLHYYDAVIYKDKSTGRLYFSTAGRILVNSVVPGGMTALPFTDPNGICEKLLGADAKSRFNELLYDCIWTTTGDAQEGRKNTVKIEHVLLRTYGSDMVSGPKDSIRLAQALYEIGVIASDVYSVSMTIDDMTSPVDKEQFMEKPKQEVAVVNSLYQLGLLSNESRKAATIRAWEEAGKAAKDAILDNLDPNSNTYYMLYSGARGKPAQVMQSVGFVGTVTKTADTDMEYPILHGYGEGLTSLDLFQTCYSARIGVISTQSGTQDTGYLTRQSVYMTSSMSVTEDDCGISNEIVEVEQGDNVMAVYNDGTTGGIDSLLEKMVDPDSDVFYMFSKEFTNSSFTITQPILDMILDKGITHIDLIDGAVDLKYTMSDEWRTAMLEQGYSYALPYTDGMKITEKTLDWVANSGLKEIIAFDQATAETGNCFNKEAYLPVDFSPEKPRITLGGKKIKTDMLLGLKVDPESEGYQYYSHLLQNGELTHTAISYLLEKSIQNIKLDNGDTVEIRYSLTKLFRSLIEGRVSVGLPGLDENNCITSNTIKEIETLGLRNIPVRTGVTCLCKNGICKKCFGKTLTTGKFAKINQNLGITASQTICEPLSQATLDVNHSGGKRSAGVGLTNGIQYYSQMLKGTMTSQRTEALKEVYAHHAGYVVKNARNGGFLRIVDDNGESLEEYVISDDNRIAVPLGAYVDVGDTIILGLPDLEKCNSHDVFQSAIKMRYMLMQEYDRLFSSQHVSAKNTEVLARAQTSICYLDSGLSGPKTKDTAEESMEPTGSYLLKVSRQKDVVNRYSGIAGFAFGDVAKFLAMDLVATDGIAIGSGLGNLITGTKVGDTTASFLPKSAVIRGMKKPRSAVRQAMDDARLHARNGVYPNALALGSGGTGSDGIDLYSKSAQQDVFASLLSADLNKGITDGTPENPMPMLEAANAIKEREPKEVVLEDDEPISATVVEEKQEQSNLPPTIVMEDDGFTITDSSVDSSKLSGLHFGDNDE